MPPTIIAVTADSAAWLYERSAAIKSPLSAKLSPRIVKYTDKIPMGIQQHVVEKTESASSHGRFIVRGNIPSLSTAVPHLGHTFEFGGISPPQFLQNVPINYANGSLPNWLSPVVPFTQ